MKFRGVRGSVPAPGDKTGRYGGNTSCVEVRAAGHVLILDAGTGIRQLGCDLQREFGARPIKASVLISHSHWDHIQGLPFFAPAFEEATHGMKECTANFLFCVPFRAGLQPALP